MTREEEFCQYVDVAFATEWVGNLGLVLFVLGVCGPVLWKAFGLIDPVVSDQVGSGVLLVLVMLFGIAAGVGLLWLEDRIIQKRCESNV